MILDSFKNAELYYNLCPGMKCAFDFIAKTDLASLEEGRHSIDGDEVFVNIMERELKKSCEAKIEVHNEYADIQVLLVGESEAFGWSERKDLNDPITDFDEAKDVQLFDDVPQTQYSLRKDQFTILLPEDGHAPMIGEGKIKKAIFKVRMAK
ncbi:MAG: YhcH/YjgK/YiaL family protein [Rikenellaceae bacterium]